MAIALLLLNVLFTQYIIWHNSWSIWRIPSILGSYERIAVGE